MKIHVKEDIYVESDNRQFLIKKYGNSYLDEDGNTKESYQVLGYYGTLEQLINGLVNRMLLDSNANTFKELTSELKHLRRYINELIQGD